MAGRRRSWISWLLITFASLIGLAVLLAVPITLILAVRSVLAEPLGLAVPRGQPLPAGPQARTQRDFVAGDLKWRRETEGALYQQMGRKNPAWDAAALVLLEDMARYGAGAPDRPSRPDLLQAVQPLLGTGCDDPLVLWAMGVFLTENDKWAEAEPLLLRSVEGFQQVPYPKCRAWLAPLALLQLDQKLGGEKAKEADKWADLALTWLGQAVAENNYVSGNQRFVWVNIESVLKSLLAGKGLQLYTMVTQEKDADPWLVAMIGGVTEKEAGWNARGGAWASEVGDAAWKQFHEHLAKAQELLTTAWKLHPEYPEPAAQMIGVVGGEGGWRSREEERLWFDRSVAGQIDWAPAYDAYINFLLPRWGGSHEQLYAFGLECLATKRFDTTVPSRLLDCVLQITDNDGEVGFWKKEGVYENLREMFEGILAEPYWAKDKAKFQNHYAAVAYRCGQYEQAQLLFKALGTDASAQLFHDIYGLCLPLVRGQALALTGPQAPQAQKAEQLYQDQQVDAALPIFEQLAQGTQDAQVLPYLRDRVAALRVEAALAKDQWADFMLPPDLAGWWVMNGIFNALGEDAVGSTRPGGVAMALSSVRLPASYEMRGEVDFPSNPNSYAAVYVGYRLSGAPCLTRVQFDRRAGATIQSGAEQIGVKGGDLMKDKNDFLLQVRGDRLTVSVNGQELFTDLEMAHFGGNLGNQAGFETQAGGDEPVLLRRVQVRRLTGGASPAGTSG